MSNMESWSKGSTNLSELEEILDYNLEIWRGAKSPKLHLRAPKGRVLCTQQAKKTWVQVLDIHDAKFLGELCKICDLRYKIITGIEPRSKNKLGAWFNEVVEALNQVTLQTRMNEFSKHPCSDE